MEKEALAEYPLSFESAPEREPMEILDFYAQLLELAWPWTVKSVSLKEQPDRVDVYLECAEAAQLPCPLCERACVISSYSPPRTWRHTDTCLKRTFLHAGLPVMDCPVHGRQHPRIPWVGGELPTHPTSSASGGCSGSFSQDYTEKRYDGLPVTTAFEKWIIRLSEALGDPKKAALFAGVEYTLLRRLLRQYSSETPLAETAKSSSPHSSNGAGAILQATPGEREGQLSLFARNDLDFVNRGIQAFSCLELEKAVECFQKHRTLYPKGYDISSRLKAAEFLIEGMRKAPADPGDRPAYLCRLWDSFEEYSESGDAGCAAFAAKAKSAYFVHVLKEVERNGPGGPTILPGGIPAGFILLQAGRYEEAIRNLQESIPKMPESAALYGWLGDAYLLRGDREVARRCYREACFIDPLAIDWRHIEDPDLKQLKQDILFEYDFDAQLALEWLPSHARIEGLFECKAIRVNDGLKETVNEYLAMEREWSEKRSPRLAAKLFARGIVLCENGENLKFIKKIDLIQVRRMMKQANPELFEDFLENIINGKA
jgi:tetratricopeptide (TPR) repeat protein